MQQFMVQLRDGSLLSFRATVFTDEANARSWASRMHGVAIRAPGEVEEEEPKKKGRTYGRRSSRV